MLAFVDESKRIMRGEEVNSIGFYMTKSFEPAYDVLINGYLGIIDKYGLRIDKREIKFSTILNELSKSFGKIDKRDIARIFDPLLAKLRAYGYCLAFVFKHYEIFDASGLIRDYIEFITSLENLRKIRRITKTPSYHPSKKVLSVLSIILLSQALYGVEHFIVDHNFVTRSDLKFLNASLNVIGKRPNVKYCSPSFEKGILIADFVAGLAKYIAERKKIILITDNINIFMTK